MPRNAKTRSNVEAALIRKAWADAEFKKQLMADSTAVYAAESKAAGTALPEGTEVRVVEESGNHLYLILPNVEIPPSAEVKLHDRSTRAELEAALIVRAMRDADFKKQLIDNPKAAYEAQLASFRESARLPGNLTIKTFEESGNVLYFRLPQAPPEGGELNVDELEAVAGGAVAVVAVITAETSVGSAISVVALAEDPQQTERLPNLKVE